MCRVSLSASRDSALFEFLGSRPQYDAKDLRMFFFFFFLPKRNLEEGILLTLGDDTVILPK